VNVSAAAQPEARIGRAATLFDASDKHTDDAAREFHGRLLKFADESHFFASFRSEARNLLLAIH
jgi:hypothetical protein